MIGELNGPFDDYNMSIAFAQNTASQHKLTKFYICVLDKGRSNYEYYFVVGVLFESKSLPKDLQVITEYEFTESKWKITGYRNLGESKWQIPS